MDSIQPIVKEVFQWAQATEPLQVSGERLCTTRDVLDARVERMRRDAMRAGMEESASYLLHAVLSEIGGNSFDHNLGAWRDIPGAFFGCDQQPGSFVAVLADRGQGILATIRPVKPSVVSHFDALKTAFLERLSGRAPERRGNGLKFVRRVLLQADLNLRFQSGDALYKIEAGSERWETTGTVVPGCFAVISWIKQ